MSSYEVPFISSWWYIQSETDQTTASKRILVLDPDLISHLKRVYAIWIEEYILSQKFFLFCFFLTLFYYISQTSVSDQNYYPQVTSGKYKCSKEQRSTEHTAAVKEGTSLLLQHRELSVSVFVRKGYKAGCSLILHIRKTLYRKIPITRCVVHQQIIGIS